MTTTLPPARGTDPGPLELSVVIPLYDEAANLRPLAAEIAAALDPTGIGYEVVWVDDGSRDGSAEALVALAAADPRHRVISLGSNRGQSAALAAGFRAARAPWTVTLDADLQNDPADVPRLLAAVAGPYDVVCGVRVERRDTWVRRVSSRVANAVRNRLTGESIADVGCTLRVMPTALAARAPLFDGMHRFLPTLLRMSGARLRELPVHHRPRRHGTTKYGIHNRLWRGIADLFAVRWLAKRWIDPRWVEEITPWATRPSGSGSVSAARPSSSAASSSSGSPPSAVARASSPPPSGSSPSAAG
ncbi:MAG TPA: glycosyltransferase [Thermoanaerobaculia bacterium]